MTEQSTKRHSSVDFDFAQLAGDEILAHAVNHNFDNMNDPQNDSERNAALVNAHRLMVGLELDIRREALQRVAEQFRADCRKRVSR